MFALLRNIAVLVLVFSLWELTSVRSFAAQSRLDIVEDYLRYHQSSRNSLESLEGIGGEFTEESEDSKYSFDVLNEERWRFTTVLSGRGVYTTGSEIVLMRDGAFSFTARKLPTSDSFEFQLLGFDPSTVELVREKLEKRLPFFFGIDNVQDYKLTDLFSHPETDLVELGDLPSFSGMKVVGVHYTLVAEGGPNIQGEVTWIPEDYRSANPDKAFYTAESIGLQTPARPTPKWVYLLGLSIVCLIVGVASYFRKS